jgi:hypothetical protein
MGRPDLNAAQMGCPQKYSLLSGWSASPLDRPRKHSIEFPADVRGRAGDFAATGALIAGVAEGLETGVALAGVCEGRDCGTTDCTRSNGGADVTLGVPTSTSIVGVRLAWNFKMAAFTKILPLALIPDSSKSSLRSS